MGLSWAPGKTAFIGSELAHEIAVGNAAGMITVRMKTGANRTSCPKLANEKLTFEMAKLSDVFEILGHQA